MTVAFRVLGTLEVTVRGRVVPLPAGHSKVALAGLLLRANELVTHAQLARWLWNGAPPGSDPVKNVQVVMARLRKSLGEANVVTTVSGGYSAVLSPDQLDLARFRELVGEGAHAEALSLWRGPVLPDVVSESLRREEIDPLAEERLAALDLRIADDLARGRHAGMVPELRGLTREHPLREPFWAHLIVALHRCGRQAEALAAYRAVARFLAEELGSTPSRELRDLHERILTGADARAVPHQLPAVNPHFAGREAELTALGSEAVSVIHGTAGVGKTTLAVSWCRAVAGRFPGGQLYVNLRGFDPSAEPAQPLDVLRGFLDALKVPAAEVPSTVEERAALFRGLVAGRKMLMLLDNARDADQVRPLLPRSPDCLVVVTSRNRLPGLADAHPISLTTLTHDESEAVLASHLGTARLRAEPDAVRDLVERCAGLPLALAVVAARAATTAFPLRDLADDLAGPSLDVLSDEDSSTDLRAVFSWSYQQLSSAAARLFRLLGVRGGGVIGVHAATALAGGDVRESLAELVRAELVSSPAPDRFSCHDLLTAYSAELSESDPGREAARDRLLDYYLHCADIADDLLPVSRNPMAIEVRHRPSETPPLATAGDAMAWFDTELANVTGAIELAAATGRPTRSWQLTYTLSRYLWLRADWLTWLRVCQVALPCTEGLTTPRLAMLFNISGAHHRLRDFGEALRWLTLALDVSREVSSNAQALVLSSMGHALRELHRYDEAEHRYRDALRKAGSPGTEAMLRHNLAILLSHVGRYEESEQQFTAAFPLYEEAGEHVGGMVCHLDLAEIQRNRGLFAEARSRAEASLVKAREYGSPMHEATSLELIGDALAGTGAAGAAEQWTRALEIYEKIDAPPAGRVRAKLQAVRNV